MVISASRKSIKNVEEESGLSRSENVNGEQDKLTKGKQIKNLRSLEYQPQIPYLTKVKKDQQEE